MIRVRLATAADIPALVELGREMHVESRYAWITYAADRVWERLERLLGRDSTCCFIALDAQDNPVGFLLGATERYMFARARLARLQYLYVAPGHRGGMTAMKFLHGFRQWALSREAVELHLGAHFGVAAAKTDRLFRRLGFQMVGGTYSRWVDQEMR